MIGTGIVQALMAILVALPPGTFRALDALCRSCTGPSAVCRVVAGSHSDNPRTAARSFGAVAQCECDVESPAPHRSVPPFQGRSAAVRTFITKNAPELDATCWNASPPFAVPDGLTHPSSPLEAARAIDSPRHAHCAPRRALIAVGALLI